MPNPLKDLAAGILSTVQISPELLLRAGIYFNANVGDHNLFAEHRLGQQQAYLFSWTAHATARDLGANAAEAKRYMAIVDAAFGCLGYHVEVVAKGVRLTPRYYQVRPDNMNRNLTGLEKLGLLMFVRHQDDFVIRLAHEHLTNLDVVPAPRFFGFFVY